MWVETGRAIYRMEAPFGTPFGSYRMEVLKAILSIFKTLQVLKCDWGNVEVLFDSINKKKL